ncbi:hypothetical protein [Nocardia aurea]|uniref:hypothetical protein n=1 Tax=Nocardia aurea TaxID=2144174 RepID=UPI0033AD1372
MRTPEQLKSRWLTEAEQQFARPEMFARSGPEMESVAGGRLRELCYLDDRDIEYEQVRKALRGFGKFGVHGPFEATFGEKYHCTAEVASVYAEFYHRLGYLELERVLGPTEWAPMTGLRDWVANRDLRRSEIEATFGEPSLRVSPRVLCYAPSDGGPWVFFDCLQEVTHRYVPGAGRMDAESDADPLVRDIRTPAAGFEDGLVLTLYGKVLRWGPGWWIHQPSETATDEQKAIAEQLRNIEADDPSRGFRR